MQFTIKNKEHLEILSITLISMAHQDWPDEKKCAVGKSKENLIQTCELPQTVKVGGFC